MRLTLPALSLLLFSAASGATFDPDLTWRTIQTDHFDIHFHQGEEQLADELAAEIERIHDTLSDELQWIPRGRTQVTLIDRTDMANGYASYAPYNRIVIYVTAPSAGSSLDLYDAWLPTIATHEYTHVLHMDTNHGLVRAARWVIGRSASTNALSPKWLVEGLATDMETRHTPGGRGRAPSAHMVKRTAVLEDRFPPLGSMDGWQPAPPAGNLRYLFGQDFVRYVADAQGRYVWTRWSHVYGSSVPYLLPGRWVLGEPLPRLYQRWRGELDLRYGAQAATIAAQGLREGEVVSDPGASCTAPAFSPDGDALVWSCRDLRSGSAIWIANGQGQEAEVLVQDRAARSFTWRADSAALVYSGVHIVNRFNAWSDVFLYDLGADSLTLLTAGARAADPDFSPDGSHLVVVTNRVQQNQLELLTVDQRQQALTDFDDHTQLSSPRYAPDGRSLVVSVRAHGRRDLWLFSPEGEVLRRLTQDLANDGDPRWSADGRWLFFSSERTGVPNVFAVEVATERVWQVTNVLTGATHPSPHPDGTRLAYQQYGSDGWTVRVMTLDPSTWIDHGRLPPDPLHPVALRDLVSPVEPHHGANAREAVAAWSGAEVARGHGRPVDPFSSTGCRELALGGPCTPSLIGPVLPQQAETFDTYTQIDVDDAFGAEQDYPFRIEPRRYSPAKTLLPRYLIPYGQISPYAPQEPFGFLPWGAVVGLSTGSADALYRYGWSAGLQYRLDAAHLGGYATVTVNRWLPVYSAGVSHTASPVGWVPIRSGEDVVASDQTYWQRQSTGWLSVSYPYTHRTTVFGRYSLTHRVPRFELPEGTATEALPTRGYVGTLQGGWRYSWSEPTDYAISREDGRIFSLVGGVLHPWLGTWLEQPDGTLAPFSQLQLTAEVREYRVVPWAHNHVIAVRAAGGGTLGETDNFGTYQLGGSVGDTAFYATPEAFRMVRGYPMAHDVGDMYWLAGAEYRLPLWRVERGAGLIPAYLRYVSASVFVDAGNAFTVVSDATDLVDGTLVGTGAELHVSGIYAWGVGITGRLGYAIGWTEDGFGPGDPRGLYFQLGGTY